MLRQAQAEAALQRQADLPAFAMTLPGTVAHRTVFVFHLDGGPVTARRRRAGPARVAAPVTAGLVLLAGITACETSEPANVPVPPVAVALNANVPDHLSIGVVITLASAPGQGAEWRDAAEGTQVGAHRFALGGAEVDLVPVNDKGTVAGAAAAVRTLTDRGVAGIVVATSGSHISGALTEAVKGDVPMLLPYEDRADALPPQTWLTGPDRDSVDATLTQTLRGQNAGKVFLIRAGGAPITGLTPTASRSFRAGNDPAVLAKTVARRAGKRRRAVDAVAITGPAHLQADVVHALQGAGGRQPGLPHPRGVEPSLPRRIDAGRRLPVRAAVHRRNRRRRRRGRWHRRLRAGPSRRTSPPSARPPRTRTRRTSSATGPSVPSPESPKSAVTTPSWPSSAPLRQPVAPTRPRLREHCQA